MTPSRLGRSGGPVIVAAQGALKYAGFFSEASEETHAYGMRGHIFEVDGCLVSLVESEFARAKLLTFDGADFFFLWIEQRHLVVELSNR